MKTHLYLLLAFALVSGLSSCRDCGRGSRNIDSQTFGETGFTTVEAGGAFNVTIQYGDNYSIKVTTQERILDNVVVDKDGNRLELRLDRRHCNCDVPIEVEITMPSLSRINASGGSSFDLNGFSNTSLSIDASGGAKVEGSNLNLNQVNLITSGGSGIDLNGTADEVDIDMSGGSQVYLYDLNSNDIHVDGSGGSHAEIRANGSISVDLSGGSKVEYKGNASISAVNTSGGSSLVNRN